jgi:chromate transporter
VSTPPPAPERGSEALHRPASATALFLAFNRLALQGFGGVLAVSQRELVERRRWISRDDFVELLSAAQVLPGPNIVNLALMLGDRHFGLKGAFAALAGLLAVPLLIVLTLASLYASFSAVPQVSGALRGMSVVAAGLVIATASKLIPALRKNAMGWPACAAFLLATLLAIAALRLPLAWVILGLGGVAMALAWTRLKP